MKLHEWLDLSKTFQTTPFVCTPTHSFLYQQQVLKSLQQINETERTVILGETIIRKTFTDLGEKLEKKMHNNYILAEVQRFSGATHCFEKKSTDSSKLLCDVRS